jgi:hypothetical protein
MSFSERLRDQLRRVLESMLHAELEGDVRTSVAITAEFYRPRSVDHALRKARSSRAREQEREALWVVYVRSSPAAPQLSHGRVTLPANTEEIYLELFLWPHQCDEFYYGIPPNGYAQVNGVYTDVAMDRSAKCRRSWTMRLLSSCGRSRVIGGLNPYLWRPISAIGVFDALTYLVNPTAFERKLVDNKTHKVTFVVDDRMDFCPIDGNSHVYVDAKSRPTIARVHDKQLETRVVPVPPKPTISGVDATFTLVASRALRVTSSVRPRARGSMNWTRRSRSCGFTVLRSCTRSTLGACSEWLHCR